MISEYLHASQHFTESCRKPGPWNKCNFMHWFQLNLSSTTPGQTSIAEFLTCYRTKRLQIQFTSFKAKHVLYVNWQLAARIMLYKKKWFSSTLTSMFSNTHKQPLIHPHSNQILLWNICNFSHYDPWKSFATTTKYFFCFQTKEDSLAY